MSERDLENFLARHPLTIPTREQTYTPLLLSDSKGKRLKHLSANSDLPILYVCQGGATTQDCLTLLEEFISRHPKPVFVYVWTGTCDITRKSDRGKIQVRAFDDRHVERIVQTYTSITECVLRHNGRVKFIGIPSYSVSRYNQYRSGVLVKSEEKQDKEVCRQIGCLNQHICSINERLGVNTLKFNADLLKSHKGRKTINFNLLSDGIHQGELLGRKWLRKLQLDIVKTCFRSESDVISIDPQELLEFEIHQTQDGSN